MTRVTNFGIKRTYLQAGFSDSATEPAREGGDEGPEAGGDEGPPKKRKRVRKRKPKKVDGAPGESEREENNAQKAETGISRVKLKATRKNKEGRSKNDRRQASSENRRIMRIQERRADTTCFVCREKGHTAKECQTTAKTQMEDAGRSVVGICYRCGLTRHNLSRCKKPVDEFNPLPFASCFVCHGKGHLASSCPQNKNKGIYPNGGSCKLCGDTSHLAKNCGLRTQESTTTSMVVGAGKEAGADEDDFHILNRRRKEVDRDERKEKKQKRVVDTTAAAKAKTKTVYF